MSTFSASRLSDTTLKLYESIVTSGGELTPARKKRLLSHLRLLATSEGHRSELLRTHNDFMVAPAWAKQSHIDRGTVPWTVLALSKRIPPTADLTPPPSAAAVNFRPGEG